jgi:hypothetical protein
VPDTNASSACFIPKCFLRWRMSWPSSFEVMAFKVSGVFYFSIKYYRSVKNFIVSSEFTLLLPIGNKFAGETQAEVVSGGGSVAFAGIFGSSRRSTLQGFSRCRAGSVAAVYDCRGGTESWRTGSFFGGSADVLRCYRVLVILGRDAAPSASQDSAAKRRFPSDAMAALPRKWVSGGAPTLPCIHERAAARVL